jgi:hypothetical protein
VACGLSQATNSTPESIIVAMKATLRESRSSLAMTSRALCFRQAARAFASSGRSLRVPLSTSVRSASRVPPYAREVAHYGGTLGLKTEARPALPISAHPVIGNESCGFGLHLGTSLVTGGEEMSMLQRRDAVTSRC